MGTESPSREYSIAVLSKDLGIEREELESDIRAGLFSASSTGDSIIAMNDEVDRYRDFVVRRSCAKSVTAWQFLGRRLKADAVPIGTRKHRFPKVGRTITFDVYELSETQAMMPESDGAVHE